MDNTRVGSEDTVYVRKVFIEISLDSSCDNGTSNICTFSRGGSDITGSIIAAGVKADLYENFTDVDL